MASQESRRLTLTLKLPGAYVLTGGVISFAGWALDVRRFTDWFGLGVSIQPNSTVAAVAAGAALVLRRRSSRLRVILGVVSALLGATAIFENLADVDLGVDTIFMFGRTWGQTGTLAPGRMGTPGSIAWTLIGIGLVLLGLRKESMKFVPVLGILVTILSAVSLTGFLYGANTLYSLPRFTTIALQTATFVFACGVGLVIAVPEREPMRVLLDDTTGGILARRFLPFVIVLPLLLGYARLRGQEAGYYDTAMGTSLLVLGLIVIICLVLWRGVATVGSRERTLREAEVALRNADRHKNEFLATLAHELRNPLAPIASSIEILKHAQTTPELMQQLTGSMEHKVQHMVRLIDDLMDISRITHNRLELRVEVIDIAHIVRQCVEFSRAIIQRNDHTIALALPDTAIFVAGDSARLSQVVDNLLMNANRYTDIGGSIQVEVRREGNDAIVNVTDSGVGIPADMLERVFDPFIQVDRSLQRAKGGLGIGLSLVRRIVELHGGGVSANSDGPGTGSTFVVRIPVAAVLPVVNESVPAIPARSADAVELKARPRVLVVDDNHDAVNSLALLLRLSGYEVAVSYDGTSAIASAGAFRPQCILLDLGLPDIDGFHVCRAIRDEPWGRSIRIAALTGWGQDEDRRQSKAAGFDAHFVKPADNEVLMAFLAESVQTASPVPVSAD